MGYFKALRRKIGVALLMMACVLAAAWVRSLYRYDSISVATKRELAGVIKYIDLHFVAAEESSLVVALERYQTESTSEIDSLASEFRYPKWQTWDTADCAPTDRHYKWNFWGVRLYEVNPGPDIQAIHQTKLWVPFWLLITPITLLSAWLLLSKPRSGFNRVSCHSVSEHES